jgi:hypothetical protein
MNAPNVTCLASMDPANAYLRRRVCGLPRVARALWTQSNKGILPCCRPGILTLDPIGVLLVIELRPRIGAQTMIFFLRID